MTIDFVYGVPHTSTYVDCVSVNTCLEGSVVPFSF